MPARTYAQINCSLTHSKKLKQVKDHRYRWAYLCIHLSQVCNFIGMFRYPVPIWANDADLTPDELNGAIEALEGAGLIEFDHDEETVRVVGWFYKQNCPENASRMVGLVKDYSTQEADSRGLYLRSIAEFLVGCVQRSQRWSSTSPDLERMRESLGTFAKQICQNYEREFLVSLSAEMEGKGSSVVGELISLVPLLAHLERDNPKEREGHPVDTLLTHETETRRDLNKTKTETKTKTKTGTNSENSPEGASPATSLPDDGSEGLRNESQALASVHKIRPLEETKRSALAMGARST